MNLGRPVGPYTRSTAMLDLTFGVWGTPPHGLPRGQLWGEVSQSSFFKGSFCWQ